MKKIATLLATRPEPFMVSTVLLTITAAVVSVTRFSLNADVSSFMTEGNAAGQTLVDLNSKYTTTDPIQILASLPKGETLDNTKNMVNLAKLSTLVANVTGIDSVSSILPPKNPLDGSVLNMSANKIEDWPDAVSEAVADSLIAGILLSEDKRHTLVMAIPCPTCVGMDVAAELKSTLANSALPGDITVMLSGNPVIFAEVISLLTTILFLIPPLLAFLLLLIFFLSIGNVRLTIFSILPAMMGSTWTFGLIFAGGLQIDVVTIIVPIFVVVMGSADGLHFVMHFQEEIARGASKVERVETTLTQIGIPMILTTISTAAGFVSLCFTGVRPIVQMGAFAAAGITLAGVISFFFLPALLSKVPLQGCPCCPCCSKAPCCRVASGARGDATDESRVDKHAKGKTKCSAMLTKALKFVVKRRAIALALSGGMIVFSSYYIPRIAVDTDQLFFFKDDHAIRESFALQDEIFGGATPLIGEFAFNPSSTDLNAELAIVRKASKDLEALPGVKRVFSMADVAAEDASQAQLEVLLDPDADVSDSPLGRMVTQDGLRFTLFPSKFSDADVQGWQAYQTSNSGVVRALSGMPIVWGEVAKLVLRAQIESLGYAFGLVAVLLLITYRNPLLTFIALLPLALTVAFVIGFISAYGMKLNLVTAIISSIVIGVGIDYSIHFIAAMNYAKEAGGGKAGGYALQAIDKAGRPVLANALGISAALSALWTSPLKTHGEISIIMWVAMLPAALTTLLVIPALMPSKALDESVEFEMKTESNAASAPYMASSPPSPPSSEPHVV